MQAEAKLIKNVEDINAIYQHFISKNNYRDAAFFMTGINTGLYVGDVLSLKFGHFYDRDWQPIRDIKVIEQKTRETRGEKRVAFTQKFYGQHAHLSETERKKRLPRERYVYVNDNVLEALDAHMQNSAFPVTREDFVFRRAEENVPVCPSTVWRSMQGACDELGLNIRLGTHGLRKTFGYHFVEAYKGSDAALCTLQRIFGHSNPEVTLRYIGLEPKYVETIRYFCP